MTGPDLPEPRYSGAHADQLARGLGGLRLSLSDRDIRHLLVVIAWLAAVWAILWLAALPLGDWPLVGRPLAYLDPAGSAYGILKDVLVVAAFLLFSKFLRCIDRILDARQAWRDALLAALQSAEDNQARRHRELMLALQGLCQPHDRPVAGDAVHSGSDPVPG